MSTSKPFNVDSLDVHRATHPKSKNTPSQLISLKYMVEYTSIYVAVLFPFAKPLRAINANDDEYLGLDVNSSTIGA